MYKHQLFLSLGGNLGNKSEIFNKTLTLIAENIGDIAKISSIYESPAWGFESDLLFWNQILMVQTALLPNEVLQEIGKIEIFFGRERKPGLYLSRKMDIDILFYDNLILKTEKLTIPHPLIGERRFILQPLAEIAPALIHPENGLSIENILQTCTDKAIAHRISNEK